MLGILAMPPTVVSLNMPISWGREPKYETVLAYMAAGQGGDFRVDHVAHRHSLLTHNFNCLWANALNARRRDGVTHFAMLHDDVVPMNVTIGGQPVDWLVHLYDLMRQFDADLISAVIPIKHGRGKTSTALESGNPWQPHIQDLQTLYGQYGDGATFTDERLLVNTGLFLLRLDRILHHHDQHGGPIPIFRQADNVVFKDGQWKPETIPEDWDFSRQIRALGGKIFATLAIPLYHGMPECHNGRPITATG